MSNLNVLSRPLRICRFSVLTVLLAVPSVTWAQDYETDPRVQDMLAVKGDISAHILQYVADADPSLGDPLVPLQAAWESKDSAGVARMLNYSDWEIASLQIRLDADRESLLAEDPALATLAISQLGCTSCSDTIDAAFAAFRSEFLGGSGFVSGGSAAARDGCNYRLYIAALLLCTRAGPIAYWPCAYLAFCKNCYGPLRNRICGTP
jgi:hypothetical protein